MSRDAAKPKLPDLTDELVIDVYRATRQFAAASGLAVSIGCSMDWARPEA